ncbi:myelin-associated oligodendrocyte basic protein isoform X2 [Manis javanica]|uniref:myelin-associated oligodendrocyte basic protein isoform X2 n=1 Tax=Manis javanica TaxID=9974 RepID=UPI003C6D6847
MSEKARKEGRRLSKNQRLSEHFSIRCCPPFTFLNSTREIVDRKYSICKSGCFYQKKEEDWICCACQRTSIWKIFYCLLTSVIANEKSALSPLALPLTQVSSI